MPMLNRYFAYNSFNQLKQYLKDGVVRHAEQLLGLLEEDGKAQVSLVLSELFPMAKPASANTQLNRLRHDINKVAREQNIPLELSITQDKRAGADHRWVWFEGGITGPKPAHTSELNAIPKNQLIEDQRGVPIDDLPVVMLITFNEYETQGVLQCFSPDITPPTETRDHITYSVLGIHGGMLVVHRISKQGEGEAQSSARDAWEAWRPRAVIAVGIAFGVNPAEQTIGDVLVSEAIRGYDLSRVEPDGTITPRGPTPPASPVLFQRFNHLDHTRRADTAASTYWPHLHFGILLSGNKLVDNVDYRNNLLKLAPEAKGGEMEAVGVQLAADRKKMDWIIVKAICDWGDGKKNNKKKLNQKLAGKNAALVVKAALDLGNLYGDSVKPSTASAYMPTGTDRRSAKFNVPRPPSVRHMNLRDSDDIPEQCWVQDTAGMLTSLHKDGDNDPCEITEPDTQRGVEVLPYLLDWVDTPDAPALFALLGEYGMGKTVTSQKLSKTLDERVQKDPTQPVPLYFDLRHVTGLDRRVPTLRETLEECMERGWQMPPTTEAYTLESVFTWMDNGAVVIIDGLDEVLVKLKEADGQVFTNNLLKLLSDAQQRPTRRAKLRLLLSCRTQYFRTLRDQKNHFTGQERGEFRADSYRAMLLLPLTEKQVLAYLGGSNAERFLDTIRSVHNLTELTQRPYTLKLVAEFAPEIERDRLAGRTVYGVTLYRRMAQRWLERDSGKHHILPAHKLRLAAHLAAHLWRTSSGTLAADELESWFHAWLEDQSDLKRRYVGLHPDQLEEDLRTATFLTREDEGGASRFRFAHTSLQEFFLADYLVQAVRANAPENWAMRVPSDETLDFMGQMLAEAKDPSLLQTMQQWRHEYRAHTSELLLAYTLAAKRKAWPAPLLQGMNLRGAALRGWRFNYDLSESDTWLDEPCTEAAWLDLSNVNFSGADMREVLFARVRLTGAKFESARLGNALILHCTVDQASFVEAELTATIFRHCSLNGARWTQSRVYRTQFLHCNVTAAMFKETCLEQVLLAPRSANEVASEGLTNSRRTARLQWHKGHVGWVTSCAWSGDSTRLLSAGDDGALRVWDAQSGEVLHTLTGHVGLVTSCAWSDDSTRLLSGGVDGTLRVWDAQSGEVLHTLTGHEDWVTCAWSGDGTRLLSAGYDGTLRVWDAQSGEVLHTLTGHFGRVTSCAWSGDSTRLLSAGEDGTLRVWDAQSGEVLHTLTGHVGLVTSCDWSGDSTRLLSGGVDGTLSVWDAQSGEVLHTLTGHVGGVRSCAWSGDSTRLLSGGVDGTLRVWDAQSGEVLHTLTGHVDVVRSCAWSGDSTRLLSAGSNGALWMWDAQSGEVLYTLTKHEDWVTSCAWSGDSTRLLTNGVDGTLWVWDAQSGEVLTTLTGHVGGVRSCAWSGDSTRLLSADFDSTLRVWDAQSGEVLHTLTGHGGWVTSCAWSGDSTRLLSGDFYGTLRVWDAQSGEELHTLTGHEGWVTSCVWSGDSTRLLSGGIDGTLRVWDAQSGEVLHTLTGHDRWVISCAWSGDSTRLFSAGDDGTLRVWDAQSGEVLHILTGHVDDVTSCAWSGDSTRLLSAGGDGTLRVWDAQSGEVLYTLTGHVGRVTSCAWSGDSTRLLSAGVDGALRVWDAQSGELLRVHGISTHGHAVWLPKENTVLQTSGDAWRYLAWQAKDKDGVITRLPLETFEASANK